MKHVTEYTEEQGQWEFVKRPRSAEKPKKPEEGEKPEKDEESEKDEKTEVSMKTEKPKRAELSKKTSFVENAEESGSWSDSTEGFFYGGFEKIERENKEFE